MVRTVRNSSLCSMTFLSLPNSRIFGEPVENLAFLLKESTLAFSTRCRLFSLKWSCRSTRQNLPRYVFRFGTCFFPTSSFCFQKKKRTECMVSWKNFHVSRLWDSFWKVKRENMLIFWRMSQYLVKVGTIGLLIVVAGMLGSVAGGYLLDKYKRFK